MAGEIGFALLLAIAVTKLLATSISLGVGMPGGVVGPLLFIGACVGGAVGSAAQMLMPGSASAIGLLCNFGNGRDDGCNTQCSARRNDGDPRTHL